MSEKIELKLQTLQKLDVLRYFVIYNAVYCLSIAGWIHVAVVNYRDFRFMLKTEQMLHCVGHTLMIALTHQSLT